MILGSCEDVDSLFGSKTTVRMWFKVCPGDITVANGTEEPKWDGDGSEELKLDPDRSKELKWDPS